MKYLILLIMMLSFNNIYASCFSQNEESICRYPQGDNWCIKNSKKGSYSYRNKCDFFENMGPEYSNDASGSGAYEVYITRLSPYSVNMLKNGSSIVSAKLAENHYDKTGVITVICKEKKYIRLTKNENEIIDESFLESYVKSNKETVGSFMCKDSFAIKNHRSIKDHFQDSAPLFKDFKVTDIYRGENHKLILDNFSKKFKVELDEYIKAGKVDFAGKYMAANWGCKPLGCTTGAVIDATTGKVYPFPTKVSSVSPVKSEYEGQSSNEWLFKLDSRLMIFAGNVETAEKSYPDSVLFYEFTGKEFKLLKILPYGKSKQVEPKEAEPAPQTKVETPKPAVVKTEQKTSTPKKTEVVVAKEETTKTKSGSSSFPLLVSLLGLLAWRINT